jgi:maltokinase
VTRLPLPTARQLEHAMESWLPGRRWFAGKRQAFAPPRIVHRVTFPYDGAQPKWRAELLVVKVTHSQVSAPDHYLVPVGIRAVLPAHLEPFTIARYEDCAVYDALADPDIVRTMVHDLLSGRSEHPQLTVHGASGEATGLAFGPGTARLLPGEQSNTSVVVDETVLLKVFRRLRAGENPEPELLRLLTRAREPSVPQLLATLDGPLAAATATYAVVQQFLPDATNGWSLALADAETVARTDDALAGNLASEARHMGRTVASVHRTLAAAAPPTHLARNDLREISAQMRDRLAASARIVPRMRYLAPQIAVAYQDLENSVAAVPAQRLHGDLHLGQMLRTAAGWSVIDFEGEPDRTLAERRRPQPVDKDVAGMLRSFDYASHHLLLLQRAPAQQPGESTREVLRQWTARSQRAFCAGYAETANTDPREHPALLRAYLMDKAVYELLYEVRNRPRWVPIPLGALEALVRDKSVLRGP